jgi:hypothetical protein
VRSSLEGGCLVRRGRPDGDGGERRREWWWWLRVRETERQGDGESEIQRGRDDESAASGLAWNSRTLPNSDASRAGRQPPRDV